MRMLRALSCRALSGACLVVAVSAGAGCTRGSTTVDVDCDGGSPGMTGGDSGAPEAGPPDTGTQPPEAGSPAPDGGADSAAASNPEVTYNDFGNAQNWQSFDVDALPGSGGSYLMAAFDGRYLYAIPSGNGVVARYDTQASFTTAGSWSTFDVGTVDSSAGGYRGAAFD